MPALIESTELGKSLVAGMDKATFSKSTKLGLKNAEENRPYFGKTIAELPAPEKPEGAAIVIVGGPSLHRRNLVPKILESGFKGDIICADGSMGFCLRKGLVPRYVVSVDGHPTRIVRWFGDTELEQRAEDDYFLRQDYDPAHWSNERRSNQELIALVNAHGPKMKAILSTSVHPCVARRCIESGMESYWWNPIYDDYDAPDSVTRRLFKSNGIPCLVTGGNVGTSAWIFAHAVLRRRRIALVGMDLGYAPGTPYRNTQYYTELKELLGEERLPEAYIKIHNPHLGETWLTDPTYFWYRQVFLKLAAQTDCETFNCTGGGTLFSEHVPFVPLEQFLERFGS